MNYNIESLLLELKKDNLQIYREMLINENYFRKNNDMIDKYIENAIDVSKIRFSELINNHEKLAISEYLDIFGIKVVNIEEKNPFSYPYLAIFDSNKKKIEINIKLIDYIKSNITEIGLDDSLNNNLYSLILAHELFHYLDELDKRFNNKFSIKKKFFNILEKRECLDVLKEISAIEFSRQLVNIDYSPTIYEHLIFA